LSPFATLFPAEILNVKLASGIRVRLFLKHLGNEDEDHPDKQDRNLEARIYETLLSDRSLPVVRYYGASENARTGRTELFLEYVDDWNLKYHELDYWYTAASRLGQLHRHFAGRPELADVLTHFDAAYHLQWAARALASVVETTPSLADRLEKVTNDYSRAARLLGEQTPTLVHNDLSPKNVIAYRSANPVRICFVDWEMAGAGFGLLDLVHLKYGLDPEADRQMRQAYADELRGSGLVPEDELEFQRLVDACELHKTMNRLWRNQVWKKPIEVVTRWVGEAEDLWRRVS
jgi:thiamine kinase-like enzyme